MKLTIITNEERKVIKGCQIDKNRTAVNFWDHVYACVLWACHCSRQLVGFLARLYSIYIFIFYFLPISFSTCPLSLYTFATVPEESHRRHVYVHVHLHSRMYYTTRLAQGSTDCGHYYHYYPNVSISICPGETKGCRVVYRGYEAKGSRCGFTKEQKKKYIYKLLPTSNLLLSKFFFYFNHRPKLIAIDNLP